MTRYFIYWLLVWAVISLILVFFGQAGALPGVALAALISLLIMIKILFEQWSGKVIELKTETQSSTADDGYTTTREVQFAHIKLDNNKTKKIVNQGWKVGDRLAKIRGQASINLIN
jgi:molybdopterin biosynthesis enzyme